MAIRPDHRPSETVEASTPSADRVTVAALIDDLSNRLQVVLGYAQILHELDNSDRWEAITAIEDECSRLRETLKSLTGWSRDPAGRAPWQEPRPDETVL